MAERLLATKLFIPHAPTTLVTRSRLLDRLDQGQRLTLVSAPAGYGKTTLIVEWLRRRQLSAAWLSLDEQDNDSSRFFAYLLTGLQTLQPGIGSASLDQPAEEIVTALINKLAVAPQALTLVLDDYHAIRAPAIHDSLGFLIRHQPPLLRVIIITREDPPLPLPRLRVRGQITEIRADDLRFTRDEAALFFQQAGVRLTDSAVATLDQRTEGWIAGLQLAALSLRERVDVDEFLRAFSGSHRYVIDYLIEEVLQQQPDAVQRFLSQTAILDRLTAPLCDALTERDDSQAILEQLERANLFLIPLDEERRWYRYHHLFADSLRAGLDRSRQKLLHQTAAQWFERHGLLREAVQHALASEDYSYAGDLIEQAGRNAIWASGELPTLQQWSDGLPHDILRAHPRLCLYYSRALFFRGDHAAAERYLQLAEATLRNLTETDADYHELMGVLLTNRSTFAAMQGQVKQALAAAKQAEGHLPAADVATRARIAHAVGFAHARQGDAARAVTAFGQAVTLAQAADNRILGADVAGYLALSHLLAGQLHEARQVCERSLKELAHDAKPPGAACTIFLALGAVLMDQSELEAARRALGESIDLARQMNWPHVLWRAYALLALACQAQGDDEGARQALAQAEQTASRYAAPMVSGEVAAVRARLALAQGQVEAAWRWAEGYQAEAPADDARDFEDLTLARVFLALRQPAEALTLLDHVLVSAQAAGRMGAVIEALVLQAEARLAQGGAAEAEASLSRAFALARPQAHVRPFLEAGHAWLPVLRKLHPSASSLVDDLLRRLEGAATRDSAQPAPVTATAQPIPGLVEPLSEREIDVLRLLARGKSNQEIANQLCITLGTAKWHINHIYGKLGVSSRTQAMLRAQELGLL